MSAITQKIKKLRDIKDLTQEDMAEKLHLSKKQYQKIENGISGLDVERLIEIATILDVTPADLLNADEGIYVHQVFNKVGVANKEVIFQDEIGESERKLYEKTIKDKDEEIAFLRDLLKKYESKNP